MAVQRGQLLIVMLGGGSKATQNADIAKAIALAATGEECVISAKIRVTDLPKFDMAEHLPDEQAIAEYLTIVLEENDPAALADALSSVARAQGMSEIAAKSGLARAALYKALRANAQPRFETISRVCQALGVKLVAQPMHTVS